MYVIQVYNNIFIIENNLFRTNGSCTEAHKIIPTLYYPSKDKKIFEV